MKPWRGNAALAWLAALAFFLAAVWPHIAESKLPLVGLQNLTAPLIGWPLTLVTSAMAAFLSFPTLLSRDKLLVCAGFSLCLFLVVAFYASMVAAVIFFIIAVNLIREKPPAGEGRAAGAASDAGEIRRCP
jgi:hypothetical protein